MQIENKKKEECFLMKETTIKETVVIEVNYKIVIKTIEYQCPQCKDGFVDVGNYKIEDGNEQFIDWEKTDKKNIKGISISSSMHISNDERQRTNLGFLYAHDLDKCYMEIEAEKIQTKSNFRIQYPISCGNCEHYDDNASDWSGEGRCKNPDYAVHFLVDNDSKCDDYRKRA